MNPSKWVFKNLGYDFKSLELLMQALTHRSYSNNINNERLEFLGDAVLDLIISEVLYKQYADIDEGGLSRLRAFLVRGESLAEVARQISLGDVVRLGSGEASSGGHQRASIQADAFEALIGAIYLDSSYAITEKIILKLFDRKLNSLPDINDLKDSKTALQELLQSRSIDIPTYRVISEYGPPHNRKFSVKCTILQLDIDTNAVGTSRQRAEQSAAEAALIKIRDLDDASP
ncbi:MAG: ribonuclease III [Pseudomonadota bacterium]|nr:ribonuclease III [Pseudomonadota bacterium]